MSQCAPVMDQLDSRWVFRSEDMSRNHLAKRLLAKLSRRGQWKRIDHFDALRPLELREAVLLQIGAQLGEAGRRVPFAQDEHHAESLVEDRIGVWHGGDLRDRRVPRDGHLDLFAIDL